MIRTSPRLAIMNGLKKAWCAETCCSPLRDQWSQESPGFGQCAVTALLMQDIMGGRILYNKEKNHYWNVMEDGFELDATEQFDDLVGKRVTRFSLMRNRDTRKRYRLLKNKLNKLLKEPVAL